MNKDNYEDIINLPHYEPKYHKRMSIAKRAAQFAPFSALTGYDEEIKLSSKLVDKKIELTEEEKLFLNDKIQILIENIKDKPEITITYFIKDDKKIGGEYINKTSNINKIDISKNIILLRDKTIISIDDIINITSDLFKE